MKIRSLFALIVLLVSMGSASAADLLVSAAASLKDALNEITAIYSEEQKDAKITYNYGGSGALQRQIENGAPADVFISAAAKQMDALEKSGHLLEGTRRNLLTNTLVLIAPAGAETVKSAADLAAPSVKHIAVGDPQSVPAGAYAFETLAALKLTEAVTPKLVRFLDVRQVLTSIETRNADAGFVYLTDAKLSSKVRVVATMPEDSHAPIQYPLAVVKATKHTEAAKSFVAFLGGKRAQEVFVKYGFGVAP